ncbi:MAG: gamma-glutamyltransferase [Daejeonella sp.]|uniref:gamma-glutamyltransferase n=1 Tax=Daejeonella sp. TaxID=2805397 RepID=UPI002736F42B|nr:gamma-glutamyltransferase [Daejeonella sp.]MDP3468976.1 gamma-glutamyltransferase [Daejeonella sp.]
MHSITATGFIKGKVVLIVLSVLFSGCLRGSLSKNNSGEYKKGMVVSAHPSSSKVGLDILKKGGNAVDAAVAVQFALAVVYPGAGNLGGGGFMVYRSASGELATLDFREKAPGKASRDMYLDSSGNAVTEMSLFGHLAAGVPGSVDGMVKAHEKFGKLSWAEVVQPALDLARKGFPITDSQVEEFTELQENIKKYNPGKSYFIKEKWAKGDSWIQEDLAKTLELIRDKGRDGFYAGEVADHIEAEMISGGGLISKEDLKNYQSQWREPLIGNYKDYKVITMPPTSSGGIALLQLLNSVEEFPLSKWGHNSDSTVQVVVEAERRVYADRASHLGDPDFYKVPQKYLVNPIYSKYRMKDFNWEKATLSTDIKAGEVPKENEETTHFSIVDREGNAVSVTTTLNGGYGSMVFVKGAGFLLNNEMDDFSVKPGTPNMYGLLGGEANSIVPGKRMLSSMTPTILEKGGELFMVVGTPGGSTIITSVFQTILNVIEFDMGMQAAVNAKKFHHQWYPDVVTVEQGGLDTLVRNKLEKKGYIFKERKAIGRVDAILKTQWGYYEGGADPRGDDTKMGW